MRDVELLAKHMREKALAEYAKERSNDDAKRAAKQRAEKVNQLKKLYFNAGRWAGGARDYNARKAFELINTADSL
jgi:hypothetical protein